MKKNENNKSVWVRYAATFGIGLAAAVVQAIIMGLLHEEDSKELYKILSDACMVSGSVLIGCWGILWASRNGFFDWFGYSFGALASAIRSLWKKDDPDRIGGESYGDYADRMYEKRKNRKFGHFLATGLFFLAAATATAILYML